MHKVRVWDWGIRIFHWSLVVSLVTAWASIELLDDVELHAKAGWAICSLLIFRVLWGVIVRPRYAGFGHMFKALLSVKQYTLRILQSDGSRYLGHNPLGVIAVLTIIGLLALQVFSGLLMTDEITFEGALYPYAPEWLTALGEDLHKRIFNLIKILIAVHIAAIIYYTFRKKQRIAAAMLHGVKSIEDPANAVDYVGDQQPAPIRMAVAIAMSIAIAIALLGVWIPK